MVGEGWWVVGGKSEDQVIVEQTTELERGEGRKRKEGKKAGEPKRLSDDRISV